MRDPLCNAKNDSPQCRCDEYAKVREDMLAKCITAVDARIRPTLHPLENVGIGEALAALRALREQP